MPVVPVMVAIGTALGASAGAAAAVGTIATVATVGSVGLQVASMAKANKAAKASQGLAKDTAEYNAQVELNTAKQLELDTTENIRAARREAAIYTSRQRAAYASSGVLNSGSPLAVEATTAGQMEQRIQQLKSNSEQEALKRRNVAQVGRIYGDQQARAIGIENTANMLRGGAGILSTMTSAYMSGMFSGIGKTSGVAGSIGGTSMAGATVGGAGGSFKF